MTIRSALTKGQKEAVKSPKAATVLVTSLNKEISLKSHEIEAQKVTIQTTQDELEIWRTRFHKADKSNGILNSKLEFFVGIEIFKYILSALGTGYGVNLIASNNQKGWHAIVGSILAYILVTVWQKKSS